MPESPLPLSEWYVSVARALERCQLSLRLAHHRGCPFMVRPSVHTPSSLAQFGGYCSHMPLNPKSGNPESSLNPRLNNSEHRWSPFLCWTHCQGGCLTPYSPLVLPEKPSSVTAFALGQQQGWDFKPHGCDAGGCALSQPAILPRGPV